MNQSEFLLITCNFLYAREKSRLQGAIGFGFGFGFGFHWLKKWREIFKRITKPSNCNRVTTFDCHSKFALHVCCGCQGIGINLLSRHFLPLYLNPL